MTKPPQRARQLICQNRRARHDIAIETEIEAGLVLTGTEVKSCRAGRAHLSEAYVQVIGSEAFLVGGHIAEYAFGNRHNHAPDRLRKLLLHRREIERLAEQLRHKGLTAVPLALAFVGGRVKLEFGVGRGKSHVDRRHALRERQDRREVEREVRGRQREGR